jgi:N-dimethylarginine dimethylaminohydrolase
MMHTCQSETGRLKSLFLKKAADAFVDEKVLVARWKDLNYLGQPDLSAAISEYEQFESFFKISGTEILYLPSEGVPNPDSIYCRDAAIATDRGMIICNMGKPARKNEPLAMRRAFESAGIDILGQITSPGTLEGGDVVWLDEHTLAVGYSYRSNQAGIDQLRAWLADADISLVLVPLPHYKGPGDVFHLMSVLSPIDQDLFLVYSPLLPIVFRNYLLDREIELIELPESEFGSMGCNVLALAPRECLMIAGNPLTRDLLEKAGCQVSSYPGKEISLKGGGGPTCLTRPVLREGS